MYRQSWEALIFIYITSSQSSFKGHIKFGLNKIESIKSPFFRLSSLYERCKLFKLLLDPYLSIKQFFHISLIQLITFRVWLIMTSSSLFHPYKLWERQLLSFTENGLEYDSRFFIETAASTIRDPHDCHLWLSLIQERSRSYFLFLVIKQQFGYDRFGRA